ncbi:MAG: hypothetical protein M3Z98_06295, partial [Candidatus Dormibacteraeota bacterium]|nr:hypothetical protein [Candidatus Dormibacteraeota bacterium]
MSKTKVRKGAARRYARLQTRKAWYEDLPLLPIIIGGLLLLGAIVLVVWILRNPGGTAATDPTISGIPCQSNEQLAVHYHAHLSMIIGGNETTLPAGVGIDQNATPACLY